MAAEGPGGWNRARAMGKDRARRVRMGDWDQTERRPLNGLIPFPRPSSHH